MKDNLHSLSCENVKIITRLRGNDKYSKYSKLLKLSDNINMNIPDILEKLSKTQEINQQNCASKLKLKDDIKYTMFTSGDSSNIMLVSKKPIKGSTINDALKVCDNLYEFHNSILNETSILEYDKIYNETHTLEQIYNEIINDNITRLFHKNNSCILCFGPSYSGKTYLLFGENNNINNIQNKKNNKYHCLKCNPLLKDDKKENLNKGLIKCSISKILNLIKINKQGNDASCNTKDKYELKISIYQVYFDKIFDLLSKDIKKINIQTNYDENKVLNVKLDLIDSEIRNIQDYEKIIKEVELKRKNLARNLKVKDFNKNSYFIISLKLRKKIENKVGNNIIDNYTTDYFSQIDFVELVASEIGLDDKFENTNDLSYEYSLYENTKNVYNSIIDNIACANYGITPNKESTLTLSLKNTLKTNSNIIFFNCVIPWEFPINNSFKALKFTTWLRNQVINDKENFNENKTNDDFNNNSKDIFNTINENKSFNNYHFQNENNFKNRTLEDNLYVNANQNSNINKSFQIINNNSISHSYSNSIKGNEVEKDFYFNKDEENKIKLMRNRSSNFINNKNINKSYEQDKSTRNKLSQINNNNIQNKNSYININENLSNKDKTIQTLEQTLKELDDKKLEIENKMYEDKANLRNSNEINQNSNINDYQYYPNNLVSPDVLQMKEQQDILKSDNILLKEDINRLSELNQNLENEVAQNRDIISQLKSENQKLINENSKLKVVLNDYDGNNYTKLYINEQITKDEFLKKYFDEKYLLTNKLKEIEKNCELLQKEKMQYEIEYKVLSTKYNEIIQKYNKSNYELINIRQIHDNELYNIDNKIMDLSKEVEKLQNENNDLRREIEIQRNNFNSVSKERDIIEEKYEEQKYQNDLLNKKIFEVEKGYIEALKEKEYDKCFKKEKEDNNRNKNETKNKIAQELQSKIQKYRRERLKNKNDDE